MRFKTISRVVILSLAVAASAIAQDEQSVIDSVKIDSTRYKVHYGVFGNLNLNIHQADFRALPNVPCCFEKFKSGFGTGFKAGALVDFPIDTIWRISARLGYSAIDAKLEKTQTQPVIVDQQLTDGKVRNTINSYISALSFEPSARYRIWNDLNIEGGISANILLRKKFEQIEKIIEPANKGVLETGQSYRNYHKSDIPSAQSLLLGINLGVSYDLAMNKLKSMILSPFLNFNYSFSNISDGITWKPHALSMGVAIKYCAPPPPPPPPANPAPAPMPEPPTPPEAPKLFAEVKAFQIDSASGKQIEPKITMEDFVSTNMRPLLNFVFFDRNSYELPKRYIKLNSDKVNEFNLSNLHDLDLLPTYYQVLNIIGKRLTENPKSKIKIIGCNSGIDGEKNNKELSKKRAETVKNYFSEVWNIGDKRMKISFRNLPEEASNSEEIGGPEENQRVEIESEDWDVMQPVITADTLREMKSSTIAFYPKASGSAGIKNWKLSIFKDNSQLKDFSGSGEPPAFIDWKPIDEKDQIKKEPRSIEYSLEVSDKSGQDFMTPKAKLPMERLTIETKRDSNIGDKEIDYYSLILFDFGKSKLKAAHKWIVKFVKDRIESDSKVKIAGYTDSMGEEEVNNRIATERAKATAKALGFQDAEVFGIGEQSLLYDNTLPEGRFYCRTVKITVEKEITK